MFKKILVTGADGFIGSHLTEALVLKGYSVKAFVLYNSFNSWGWLDHSHPSIKKQIQVFLGDIRDPHGVRQAMEGCDAVLHLAALIGIPYSYHSPETYVETNIKGTLNILQAARHLGIRRVIHTSTSEVYGTALTVPIREDHPLQGQSPYSATKIGADQLAMSFYKSFGLPVGILRPFNTYGPRQSNRAVIPTIINQVLQNKNVLELGAIKPKRDFVFIKDTVNAFILALETEKIVGEVIHIGTGCEISIHDLAKKIGSILGKNLKINIKKIRQRPSQSEVLRLIADSTKARRLLQWKPSYCKMVGLENGLIETVSWFKQNRIVSNKNKNFYSI